LRAALLRAAPAAADFAREDDAFFAVLRFAVDALAVERLAPARALDFLAPPLRDEPEPALVLALPSTVHLPDITRCAASATASAINEPSLVALAIMLVAACEAVSAASRPASRIARRAFGLALIAAADSTGHPAVGVLLESCLADKLAFVERTRRLIRKQLQEELVAA